MKRWVFVCLALASSVAVNEARAECRGSVLGYWEKRSLENGAEFQVIEEFRIERESGILSLCGDDRSWDAGFRSGDDDMSFVFARRERTLRRAEGNTFLSPTWVAEFQGVSSEYRVRTEVTE